MAGTLITLKLWMLKLRHTEINNLEKFETAGKRLCQDSNRRV